MNCHKRQIRKNWLYEFTDDKPMYEGILDDAFLMFELQKLEMHQSYNNQIEEDAQNEKLDRIINDPEVHQRQYQADISVLKQHMIGLKEISREIQIYKKGGIMSSIEIRPAKILQHEIIQLKAKGASQIVRNYGQPSQIILEEPQKASTNYLPWQKPQVDQSRLMLAFQNRSPIYIYFKEKEKAYKHLVYLRLYALIAQDPKLPELLNFCVESYRYNFEISWIVEFDSYLQRFAQDLLDERKRNIKLTPQQKIFLDRVDFPILQNVLDRWKDKSYRFRQEELDQDEREKKRRQQEEELRRRRQMEEELARQRELEKLKVVEKSNAVSERIIQIPQPVEMPLEMPLEITPEKPQKFNLTRFNVLNQNANNNLISNFITRWAKRAEFSRNVEQLQGLNYVLTFRCLQFFEGITASRLILDLSFYGQRCEHTSDMLSTKRINSKDYTLNPDGSPFFKLKMQAQLKEKDRTEYFSWELKENAFENFSNASRSQKSLTQFEGCQISLKNFSHDDLLCFELYDALAITEVARSDVLRLSMADLCQYCVSGRIIWIPLYFRRFQKGQDQQLSLQDLNQMVVPVQIDVKINKEGEQEVDYDSNLSSIVQSDQHIFDPIYAGHFKPPMLNKNLVKVLLKILEENNPYLKSNVKMMKFMLYIGSLEKIDDIAIPSDDPTFIEIKKYMIRKLIENVCHLLTRLRSQEQVWDDLQKASQINQSERSVYRNSIPIFQNAFNNKTNYPLLDPYIRNLCYYGLAPHARPSFWFTILDGINIYDQIKDILKRRFFIFPEQRTDLPEQTWVYQQLKNQITSLKLNLFKDIEKFIDLQNQINGIPHKIIEEQLRNVLQTFLVYGACNGYQININYLPNLFLISLRVVQLCNYQFVFQTKKRWPIFEDQETINQEFGLTNFVDMKFKSLENEGFAFWIITSMVQEVLKNYPVFDRSNKNLLEDCSFIMVHLQKFQPKALEIMKAHDLRPEAIFYDIFTKLYSETFPSEILYFVWDMIIYETIKAKNTNKPRSYIIPAILTLLLDKLSNKLTMIYNPEEFKAAISLEGCMISNMKSFSDAVSQQHDKLKQLVENSLQDIQIIDDALVEGVINSGMRPDGQSMKAK